VKRVGCASNCCAVEYLRAGLVALTLLLAVLSPAIASDGTGRASVIDGDTIEARLQRIRLHGIDASCASPPVEVWLVFGGARYVVALFCGAKAV